MPVALPRTGDASAMFPAALSPLVPLDVLTPLLLDLLAAVADLLGPLVPAACMGATIGLGLTACAAVVLHKGHVYDAAHASWLAPVPQQAAGGDPLRPRTLRNAGSNPHGCRPVEAVISLMSTGGLLCLGLAVAAWAALHHHFVAGGEACRPSLTGRDCDRPIEHLLAPAAGERYTSSARS